MLKIFWGKKGEGKTKSLVDAANALVDSSVGNVVFIDHTGQLMYDLKHEIRFVNASEYPVRNCDSFMGFICGLVSGNYDIESIFIDGLTGIISRDIAALEDFFAALKKISDSYRLDFYIGIDTDPGSMPSFLKEYL